MNIPLIACILVVIAAILTIMWAVGRETAERFNPLSRMTRLDDEMDLHDAADSDGAKS